MNIALVTIAFNGYAQWLPQWCRYVAALNPAPTQVAIAIGQNAGWETVSDECQRILPDMTVTITDHNNMADLRNTAIRSTNTEWVMYLSADDGIVPNAITILKPHTDADYICVSWLTRDTWNPDEPDLYHQARTPEMLAKTRGKGFIVGHSPYRRTWFNNVGGYDGGDLPNQQFVARLILNGAKFTAIDEPVTIYLRRLNSHARLLGRNGPADMDLALKRKANQHRMELRHAIRTKYRN